MHNVSKFARTDHIYSFSSEPTEFGADNCATHHICLLLNLVISMRPAPKIGVKWISGSTMVSGIGTIKCVLTDDSGAKHTIQLDDVIYLPESAKKSISVSKWSEDKGDYCGVISRGMFSVFMWDNDVNTKHIDHPLDCKILLMLVNECDNAYVLLNSAHHDYDPDNQLLIPNGCQPINDSEISTSPRDTDSSQKAEKVPSKRIVADLLPIGSTIWYSHKNSRQIFIITGHNISSSGSTA